MPLYHFATTDLPADTIAPEMADINTTTALRSDITFTGEDLSAGSGPTVEMLGKYMGYLIAIGFLPPPHRENASEGRELPAVVVGTAQKEALLRVGGRGTLI
jgi:L-aminoadipate-semialdehyde dehydrogenase